jgi:alcohol dehydrogenase
MRAAIFEEFQKPLKIQNVPDPTPPETGVVIRVRATGLCRSDWHGWMGHDSDIHPPHVPGHELAGDIAALGKDVRRWKIGDRVTLPFVNGCGTCPQCISGNPQVCDHQFQPGFTAWGSFAEYVAIDYADLNLVRLPETLDYVTAASLGCRFVTSFRAVVDQGKVSAGQWVAVHGCGGVGLSAIMIAAAAGANVVAVDIAEDKLALARALGADAAINGEKLSGAEIVAAVREASGGGAHLSIDALGSPATCFNSIACLRKRGKHVQVGLMLGGHETPQIPMNKVIANELEILGSHGIQAYRYPALLEMIEAGKLHPERLIGRTISLEEGAQELTRMDEFKEVGVAVIDRF